VLSSGSSSSGDNSEEPSEAPLPEVEHGDGCSATGQDGLVLALVPIALAVTVRRMRRGAGA
jgi:hypothetical protein